MRSLLKEVGQKSMNCKNRALLFGLLCACASANAQNAAQARQLLDAGLTTEAITAYSELLKASPRDPDLLLMRGLSYSRSKHWKEATSDLETAVAIAPSYADLWSALGNAYLWGDSPAAAADAYARLATLRPSDPEPQILRARALIQVGDLVLARQAVELAKLLGAPEAELQSILRELKPKQIVSSNLSNSQGHRWTATLSAGNTSAEGKNNTERSVSLRRFGEAGSIAFESLEVSRFGLTDQAWAVDAYPRLWQGAYANVHYQQATSSTLFPSKSGRLELYQGVGSGWELSASYDYLGFDSHVRINGLSVGKYWGNFYARWRRQLVRTDNSAGSGDSLILRNYYKSDADHYFELNVSQGQSDVKGTAQSPLTQSDSWGLVWTNFIARDWGLKLSISQSNDTASGHEDNVSLSLSHHW